MGIGTPEEAPAAGAAVAGRTETTGCHNAPAAAPAVGAAVACRNGLVVALAAEAAAPSPVRRRSRAATLEAGLAKMVLAAAT